MKKREREIVVDKRRYTWAVVEGVWPERVLRVWKAGDRGKPWFEEAGEATTSASVTPADVAAAIRRHGS